MHNGRNVVLASHSPISLPFFAQLTARFASTIETMRSQRAVSGAERSLGPVKQALRTELHSLRKLRRMLVAGAIITLNRPRRSIIRNHHRSGRWS
jgi:hypothetical protein